MGGLILIRSQGLKLRQLKRTHAGCRIRQVSLDRGAFAFLAMMIFAQQTGYPQLLLWGYVTASFLDGGFSAIVPYIPELYPTRAQGTGVGAAPSTGRVASALAPIVVGFHHQHSRRWHRLHVPNTGWPDILIAAAWRGLGASLKSSGAE
jgi:nitrate/nitrite transporter NarK